MKSTHELAVELVNGYRIMRWSVEEFERRLGEALRAIVVEDRCRCLKLCADDREFLGHTVHEVLAEVRSSIEKGWIP